MRCEHREEKKVFVCIWKAKFAAIGKQRVLKADIKPVA